LISSRVVGTAALAAALLAGRASASVLDFSGAVLTYVANSGVANALTVTLSSGVYTIHDSGETTITLTAAASSAGCALVDSNTVHCLQSAIGSWSISLGDQNDTANLSDVVEPTIIRGQQGNDVLVGGVGPDTFVWNPGDASDTLDGGAGADTLLFSGANINEVFNVTQTANGFQITRDVATVSLDVRNVEALNLSTLGADDTINTVPLPSTTQTIDAGTNTTNDTLNYNSEGLCTSQGTGALFTLGNQPVNFANVEVLNLQNECTVFPSTLELLSGVLSYVAGNGAADQLSVSLASGVYTIDDPVVPAIQLTTNAVAAGCANVDANTATCPRGAIASWNVSLGDQNDVANLSAVLEPTIIRGGTGNDTLVGGAANDTFLWNPGDASDTLDGGPGFDTLQFGGANINEHYVVSRTPSGFQFTRDVASVLLDVRNVEALTVSALSGDDTIDTVPLPFTTQTFDGGPQTATDSLVYDAGGACTTETLATFQTAGEKKVSFTNFENVSLVNQCANPVPVPALPAALRITLAALLGSAALWLGARRTHA
jgi:Ca2+-binding RTX toxin-like protein